MTWVENRRIMERQTGSEYARRHLGKSEVIDFTAVERRTGCRRRTGSRHQHHRGQRTDGALAQTEPPRQSTCRDPARRQIGCRRRRGVEPVDGVEEDRGGDEDDAEERPDGAGQRPDERQRAAERRAPARRVVTHGGRQSSHVEGLREVNDFVPVRRYHERPQCHSGVLQRQNAHRSTNELSPIVLTYMHIMYTMSY